jgi:hypothetical protein
VVYEFLVQADLGFQVIHICMQSHSLLYNYNRVFTQVSVGGRDLASVEVLEDNHSLGDGIDGFLKVRRGLLVVGVLLSSELGGISLGLIDIGELLTEGSDLTLELGGGGLGSVP